MKILVANGGNELAKNSEGQVPKDLLEEVQQKAAKASQLLPIVAGAHPQDNAKEEPSDGVTGDISISSQPKLGESKFLAGFGKENDTDPVVSQVLLCVSS